MTGPDTVEPTLVGDWLGDEPISAGDRGPRVCREQDGRYEVQHLLGRGAIGRVLVVRDTFLQREVALKELLPGRMSSAGSAGSARFLREARITGALEHPGIVPVYELGQREDGQLYYTMKRVRGRTLSQALQACADLGERLALLPALVSICQAVAYANARGVVHRDLKPDNMMLGEFGEAVVLDWGLVKLAGEAELPGGPVTPDVATLTRSGSTLGTPSWMSPEQARGELERLDGRSDAWSLGVVLYQVLTGSLPFYGDGVEATLEAVRTAALVPVRERAPSAPPELAAIAHRALERDLDARYTPKQLADDLSAWLTGERVSAHDYTSRELLLRFVARNRVASGAAVVVFLLTAASAVGLGLGWRAAQQARDQATAAAHAAEVNLALGLQEKARQLLVDRDPLAAGVFAAAARVHDPTGSPAHTASALYASAVASPVVHDATLGTDLDSAVISHGGERVAMAWDRHVEVLDVTSGSPVGSWEVSGTPWLLGVRADGSVLVEADGRLSLHGPDGAERWTADVEHPYRAVLSRGEHLGALAYLDGHVDFVDLETGVRTRTLHAHDAAIEHLAFSPDDARLATSSLEGRVRLWSMQDDTLLDELAVLGEALAWTPDGGSLLVGTDEGQLWRWTPGEEASLLGSSHRGLISGVAATEGLFASSDTVGRLHLWSPAGERVRITASQANDLVFTDDWLLTASSSRVDRWRRQDRVWQGRGGDYHNALVPQGDRLLSVDDDGGLWAWGPAGGELLYQGDAAALSLAVHPRHLAVGWSDGQVTLHEPDTGAQIARLGRGAPVWAVALSPDGGQLAAGHEDGSLVLHHLDRGTTERLPGHELMVQSVGYTPEGELMSSDIDARVLVRGAAGEILGRADVTGNGLTTAVLSPDGRTLLVAGRQPPTLRSMPDAEVILDLPPHDSAVYYGAFSPDGSLVATGSGDGEVRLWDTTTGRLRLVLYLEELNGLAMPTNTEIAVAVDSEVRVYPVVLDVWDRDPDVLLDEAQARAGARLEGFSLVR